jgi:hypothetical protein
MPTRISGRQTRPRPETASPRAHQHPTASARLTESSAALVAPRPLAHWGGEHSPCWDGREVGPRRSPQLVSTPANAAGWRRSARAERRGEARPCGRWVAAQHQAARSERSAASGSLCRRARIRPEPASRLQEGRRSSRRLHKASSAKSRRHLCACSGGTTTKRSSPWEPLGRISATTGPLVSAAGAPVIL